MSGVAAEFEIDLGKAGKGLRALSALEVHELADAVGTLIETQTRTRLNSERKGPDGTPWPKWSSGYAATRHGGHSLLIGERHLLDSIQNLTTGDTTRVGSNETYAAIHQFGGKIEPKNGKSLVFRLGKTKVFAKSVTIPARPYLGLSDANRREIEDFVIGDLEALFA